jgi:N,N'-diacetylchitobiose non-reducing end deacetylase
MDIRQLLGLKPLEELKSIVCVQPHPDDNEVGAGGTLAKLAENGCNITFVTVTDGRYGTSDPTVTPEALIETRRQERERAGHLLGVSKQIALEFSDGGNYSEREVMEALIPIFREEKPELVMTVDPWMPYEAHPDHYKVGRAVAAAVLASDTIGFPEAGSPFGVPQVGFYATSYPNTLIDITPYWAKKIEAILTHDSQFNTPEWPLLSQFFAYQASELFQALKNQGGTMAVEGYAEAFKVLATRQLHFFPTAIFS